MNQTTHQGYLAKGYQEDVQLSEESLIRRKLVYLYKILSSSQNTPRG